MDWHLEAKQLPLSQNKAHLQNSPQTHMKDITFRQNTSRDHMTLCTPTPEGANSGVTQGYHVVRVSPLEAVGRDALQHICQAVTEMLMRVDGAAVRVTVWIIHLLSTASPYIWAFLPWHVHWSLPLPLDVVVGHLGQVMPRVDDEAERRRGDADDVENPEARLRDGRKRIVADGGTSWLHCVAHKHLLLVGVHILGCNSDNKQPEDNHDGEPQATDHGGVLVDSIQETFKQGPLRHGGLCRAVCSGLIHLFFS